MEKLTLKNLKELYFSNITFTPSSNISILKWNQEKEIAMVNFKNSNYNYYYLNVSPEEIIKWSHAESAGKFFHKNIKTKPCYIQKDQMHLELVQSTPKIR